MKKCFFSFKLFNTAGILALILYLSLPASALESLRPPQRKLMRQLNKSLSSRRGTLVFRALDRVFFGPGIYKAFIGKPEAEIINRQKIAATSKTIKVLTANLMMFPPPMGQDQIERIDRFIETIAPLNPDFIMLQEVWDNNSLYALAEKLGQYNLVYCPSALYNRSGLAIFSRFAVKSAEFFRFPLGAAHNLEELLAQKGALQIRVLLGGEEIRLINTHLYSAPPDQVYRPNPKQLKYLLQLLNKQPEANLILAGDLNLRPAELKTLLPPGFKTDSCPLFTAGYPRHSQKLDHVLLNPLGKAELSTRRVECPRPFSDHSPVLGIIELNK